MHHLLNRPEQTARERSVALRALTLLGRTTALALLGIALSYVFLVVTIWWTSGTVVLPVLAFVIVAVIAAASVVAGVRWAPLLGALVALVIAVITLAEPLAPSALLHPAASPVRFGGLVIVLACAPTAIGAGVATAIPHAGGLQRVPHGLRSALFGLAGMVVGMILVAGVVAANPQSSAARTTSNGMPTVHVVGSDFFWIAPSATPARARHSSCSSSPACSRRWLCDSPRSMASDAVITRFEIVCRR